MIPTVKLEAMPDMGGQMNIGYERADIPGLVHVIVRAPGGSTFAAAPVYEHFRTCEVCDAHGLSYLDFQRFMHSRGVART